jgi:hypothetical protein
VLSLVVIVLMRRLLVVHEGTGATLSVNCALGISLDTPAMTQPLAMRYGSAKRDAGILRPPAKDSYVVEATIWDTRDGDEAEVTASPGDTIGVAAMASRGDGRKSGIYDVSEELHEA